MSIKTETSDSITLSAGSYSRQWGINMDYVQAKTRARRQHLDVLAGDAYRDKSHAIVSNLLDQGKEPFLGIESEKGFYTIIGRNCSYMQTDIGAQIELSHPEFLAVLRQNALLLGKRARHEFIELGAAGSVWVKDAQTMCALWNIVLYADRDHRPAIK